MKQAKSALILTVFFIPVTVLLRVVSVIRYTDNTRDWFGYALAFFLILVVIGLLLFSRKFQTSLPRPTGKSAAVLSFLCLVSGASVLLSHLVELFRSLLSESAGFSTAQSAQKTLYALTFLVYLVAYWAVPTYFTSVFLGGIKKNAPPYRENLRCYFRCCGDGYDWHIMRYLTPAPPALTKPCTITVG